MQFKEGQRPANLLWRDRKHVGTFIDVMSSRVKLYGPADLAKYNEVQFVGVTERFDEAFSNLWNNQVRMEKVRYLVQAQLPERFHQHDYWKGEDPITFTLERDASFIPTLLFWYNPIKFTLRDASITRNL